MHLSQGLATTPHPRPLLPQGERGVLQKPMDFFAPWRLCVRICVKCMIGELFFGRALGACSPAAIWPRRAASEGAATLSLDLDGFLKSFRGSQPSLALIGSAARARRFQPVYSAGARVALDRLLAAMPAAGHVSKGIMSCRLVHYRAEPEAVPIGVRALSRAGFQRGNPLA